MVHLGPFARAPPNPPILTHMLKTNNEHICQDNKANKLNPPHLNLNSLDDTITISDVV